MVRFIGILFVCFAVLPMQTHAAIIKPERKPLTSVSDSNNAVNITTVIIPNNKPRSDNDNISISDSEQDLDSITVRITEDGIIIPPALPVIKLSSTLPPKIITPYRKPLVLKFANQKRERIRKSSFENDVIVKYSGENDDRTAGVARVRVERLPSARLPDQPQVRIRETKDDSPFQIAGLQRTDMMRESDPVIIFFKEQSNDLEVGQLAILNHDLLNSLKKHNNKKAIIYGYAENDGNGGKKSHELSMSRALIISEYLLKNGISENRIQINAKGDNTSIKPKNRADIVLLN